MIRALRLFSKKDIAVAGGKGANLGELIRAGMPVPPGFVISGKTSDNKIIKAYRELGGGPVAVRSSATLEDSPNAAFAGQFETNLNVIGEKALLKAVRNVQGSLRSNRLISYCKKQGIYHKKIKMAIIVQTMIDPDFAGVTFTANPVTGNTKETLIDANPGLGEAVVAGLVTPDHFSLQRRFFGWQIVENVKGGRELIIKTKKGGGTKTIKKSDGSQLPKETVLKLAKLGEKIEKHFKTPQDVEWAVVGDKIYIIQSRPITALLAKLPRQNRVSRIMNSLISGIIPARPLPLAATTFGPETIFNKMLYPAVQAIGFRMQPINRLFKKEDGILVSYTGDIVLRPSIGLFLVPFKFLKNPLNYKVSNWKQDPLFTETIASIKKLEKEDFKNKSPKELIEHAKKAKAHFDPIFKLRIKYAARIALASITLFLILFLTGRKKQFLPLIFSGVSTKVTETNENLERLATKIRSNKTLKNIFLKNDVKLIKSHLKKTKVGQEFLADFSEFLEEYGYRESAGTINISNPSWKESPELVLGILKSLVKSPSSVKLKKPFKSNFFFKKLLNEARHLQEFREDTRFALMMPIPTLRGTLLQLGKYLVKAKVLKDKQDVFYFQFS